MTAARRRAPDHRTLVEWAAAALRDDILSGAAAPNSRIGIVETAARMRMSPSPVREALRGLASEGLVVALPRRGYRVAPVTREDFEDLFRLRTTLDLLGVELGVPRLEERHLAVMAAELERLAAARRRGDWDAQQQHHRRFHFALLEAAGSPWLVRVLGGLWDHTQRYLDLAERYRGHPHAVADEHRTLLDACRRRDVALVTGRMRDHLRLTHDTVVRMLDDIGRPEAGTVG